MSAAQTPEAHEDIEWAPLIDANDPIRFSHLRAYGRSGAHGLLARLGFSDETAAMERGTAVHAMLFGTTPVVGYPGPVRRGKEFDKFVADHPGTEILTASEYAKACQMVEAIGRDSLAMGVLEGETEKTLLFDWMGRACRATPDVRGDTYVTELKTTQSADPTKFSWHALRMCYHGQLAFQQIGCAATGQPVKDAYIVAIESSAPYVSTVWHVTERAMERGARLCQLWMERLKGCEVAREWPGYVESIIELDLLDGLELDYKEGNPPKLSDL